ncbi:MAG: GNAT family N-acetyltransferase [Gemmataceae bacterium]
MAGWTFLEVITNPMIRTATADDAVAVFGLIRALAAYERVADRAVFDEREVREHLFGPRPFAEVLLAEEAGVVVGFAVFYPYYSTFQGKPGLYLEDLFVRPEFRGRGHGKGLLVELARLAASRGCCSLEWAVLNWNDPAIAFYRSLGAEPINEWTTYRLTGDALLKAAGPSQGS